MRRAFTFALCSLLLAGCATGGKTSAPKGGATETAAASPPAKSTQVVPGPVEVVGRVIAIDPRSLTVVIDVAPYASLPATLAGRVLITRTDDLRPTARLESSPYLRGRTLGARMLAGKPQIGDEVVIAPAAP